VVIDLIICNRYYNQLWTWLKYKNTKMRKILLLSIANDFKGINRFKYIFSAKAWQMTNANFYAN